MAKVKVTALQTLAGDYGVANAGDHIELEEADAKALATAGVVKLSGTKAAEKEETPKVEAPKEVAPKKSASPKKGKK